MNKKRFLILANMEFIDVSELKQKVQKRGTVVGAHEAAVLVPTNCRFPPTGTTNINIIRLYGMADLARGCVPH